MTTRHCAWCERDVPAEQADQVAFTLDADWSRVAVHACQKCTALYWLLPLSAHPAGSGGAPLAVNPAYIGRRNAPPIVAGRPA